VIRLHGGALIVAFENVESMVRALDHLQKPIYFSWIMRRNGKSRMPISVYLVPRVE